jgi:hypothetical protein
MVGGAKNHAKNTRVTRAELARRLEVNVESLRKAEIDGRLSPRGEDGKYDLQAALQEWALNRQRPTNDGKGSAKKPRVEGERDWSTELKREQARKAKIERRALQGVYVRRDAAESEAAERGTLIRDALMLIGQREADRLAAAKTPRECRRIVDDAIAETLERLAGNR